MKGRFLVLTAVFATAAPLSAQTTPATATPVPYPDGYRQWAHISSSVLPVQDDGASRPPAKKKAAAPHGLIFNIYANEKALEGYRTGHFPEGAVLIADWFVLEPRGPTLIQARRKSINVMVRDARYTATGGWGFEDFEGDSHTQRNVGPKAVSACFECHQRAENHEYVFSVLRP